MLLRKLENGSHRITCFNCGHTVTHITPDLVAYLKKDTDRFKVQCSRCLVIESVDLKVTERVRVKAG